MSNNEIKMKYNQTIRYNPIQHDAIQYLSIDLSIYIYIYIKTKFRSICKAHF